MDTFVHVLAVNQRGTEPANNTKWKNTAGLVTLVIKFDRYVDIYLLNIRISVNTEVTHNPLTQ